MKTLFRGVKGFFIGVAFVIGFLLAGFILYGFFRSNLNPKITASNLCKKNENCIRGLTISDTGATMLSYSADGSTLYARGLAGVRVWQVAEGFKEERLAGLGGLRASINEGLVVAPDGRYALIEKDNEVRLYDTEGNKTVEFVLESDGLKGLRASDMVFVSGFDMLAESAYFEEQGETKSVITFWNTKNGSLVTQLAHDHSISSLAASVQTVVAVGQSDGKVVLWPVRDFSDYRILNASENSITELVFDATGEYLAAASTNGDISIWQTTTGERLRSFSNSDDYLTGLALSENAEQVMASFSSGKLKQWDLQSETLVGDWLYPRALGEIALSPDGQQVAISLRKKSYIQETVRPVGVSPNDPIFRNLEDSYVRVDPAVILVRDLSQ